MSLSISNNKINHTYYYIFTFLSMAGNLVLI